MASQDPPASLAVPALLTTSGSECHVEPALRALVCANGKCCCSQVSLQISTIEEVIDYIVSARQRRSESLIGFHWQASQVHDLFEQLDARLVELDQLKIRRFEYDYESETVYLDIMPESQFHYQVQAGLRDYLKTSIWKLLVATEDPTVHGLVQSAKEQGTVSIDYKNKPLKQGDITFGQFGTLPSLVCEVS